MENRPTKKQRELLSFIDGFIKGYGYGPSYREIMRALDYKSVSTVATHINGLISRGWLVKKDNSARTLEVVMPHESKPIASASDIKRPTLTAEKEIRDKIEELKSDGLEKHAHELSILDEALVILGYDEVTHSHLV
jgi:repressor LexA